MYEKSFTFLLIFMFIFVLAHGSLYAGVLVRNDFLVSPVEVGVAESPGEPFGLNISGVRYVAGHPQEGDPVSDDLTVVIVSDEEGDVFDGVVTFVDGGTASPISITLNNPGVHELTTTIAGTEGQNTLSMTILEPQPEPEPVITIIDGDEDRVYFPGDILKFELSDYPGGEDLSLAFVVFTDGQTYVNADVMAELTHDGEGGFYYMTSSPTEEKYIFEGVIQEDLPAGAVGIMLYNPEATPRAANPIPLIEGAVNETSARLDAGEVADNEFVLVGIDIPSEFEDISSNLAELNNLYNTDKKVTFEKEGLGSITFDERLNIVENREQLENLQDFLIIKYDEDNNEMVASVDTSALQFLAGHSATIQFFNIASQMGMEEIDPGNLEQYIQISVLEDGSPIEDLSQYFDWVNVSYDEARDILTLPVNHFTEYRVGEAEEELEEEVAEEEELPQTGAGFPYILLAGMLLVAGGTFTYFRACRS